MSNGPILCCAAHVCCPPSAAEQKLIDGLTPQLRALAAFFAECGAPWKVALEMAPKFMERADIVPAGVGAFIVDKYRPFFEHMAANAGADPLAASGGDHA